MEKRDAYCYDTHTEDNFRQHNFEEYELAHNQPSHEQQLWWKDQELFRPVFTSETCSSGALSRAEVCDDKPSIRSETSGELHCVHLYAHGRQDAYGTTSPAPSAIEKKRASDEATSTSANRERYEGSFGAIVDRFVFKHSEAINDITSKSAGKTVRCKNEAGEEALFANPDALEYHMQTSHVARKRRFFELVAIGDTMRGLVTLKRSSELRLKVLSFVGTHKMRELSDLNIKGVVSFEHLGTTREKRDDVLEDSRLDDVVQAIVVGVDPGEDTLQLSFCVPAASSSDSQAVHLGYLEGECPPDPPSKCPVPDDFLRHLESDPGFENPLCVENLKLALGIVNIPQPSLLNCIRRADFSEQSYFDNLRKAQRCKWSMDNVATGVQHFKSGESKAAMRYFNHALEIDSSNVEGLVARGALYANSGHYEQALKDFQSALTIKQSHKNARRYLVETQTAYGQELEKKGDLDGAVKCYRHAVLEDPNSEVATRRLEAILTLQERQAAEKREKERKKAEEKEKLKRLHKIIEEEKSKSHRDGHKKKHKNKGRQRDSLEVVAGPSLPPDMKNKKHSSKKKHHTHNSSSKSERHTSSSSDSDASSRRKRRSRERSRKERRSSSDDSSGSSRTRAASSVRGES
ncbi:hypothetical protein EMCRGX_G029597 [Ephydatia muelleri]